MNLETRTTADPSQDQPKKYLTDALSVFFWPIP